MELDLNYYKLEQMHRFVLLLRKTINFLIFRHHPISLYCCFFLLKHHKSPSYWNRLVNYCNYLTLSNKNKGHKFLLFLQIHFVLKIYQYLKIIAFQGSKIQHCEIDLLILQRISIHMYNDKMMSFYLILKESIIWINF